MSKKIEFKVPRPCHESWQTMTATEQGKFCSACQKNVIDFSMMTNQEILQQISTANENVCGRFSNQQLNTAMIISDPGKLRIPYAWSIIVAASSFFAFRTNAQTPSAQGSIKVAHRPEPVGSIMGIVRHSTPSLSFIGRVMDTSDNTPVGFATVTIKPGNTMIAADSNGNFKFFWSDRDADQYFEITAIGYEPRKIRKGEEYSSGKINTISLLKKPLDLTDIAVVAFSQKLQGRLGCMITAQRVTVFEKMQDTMWSFFSNRNLQIFPNPVMRGSVMHVKLAFSKMDAYKIEIVNSAGQTLKTMMMDVQVKGQLKSILIPADYAKGIYFIRVRKPGSNELFTKKFVVR